MNMLNVLNELDLGHHSAPASAALPAGAMPVASALIKAWQIAAKIVTMLGAFLLLALLMNTLGAVEASMAKRGNIRFGPSTKDAVVCTLNAGTPVSIIGEADADNWYKIKFPSAGHAWMHGMNLAKTDQENVMRVTIDGANVRRDATKGGVVVCTLKMNDTVQWKGPKVGQWYAVYVPEAVAYVHGSVLYIKDPARQQIAANAQDSTSSTASAANSTSSTSSKSSMRSAPIDHPTDKIWQEAITTYESYYQQLQQDSDKALHLDWAGLSDKLKLVIQDHPDLRTRIYAKRLFNGIQRVVRSAGMEAAPEISDIGGADIVSPTTGSQASTQDVAATAQIVTTGDEDGDTDDLDLSDDSNASAQTQQQPAQAQQAQQTQQQPAQTETNSEKTEIDDAAPDLALLSKTDQGVVGWLQDLEVKEIGVEYVILGDDGISAFIKLKDGLNINLKDLHWQRVRVQGETQIVDHEVDPQYRGIPLIIVDKLDVLK